MKRRFIAIYTARRWHELKDGKVVSCEKKSLSGKREVRAGFDDDDSGRGFIHLEIIPRCMEL